MFSDTTTKCTGLMISTSINAIVEIQFAQWGRN